VGLGYAVGFDLSNHRYYYSHDLMVDEILEAESLLLLQLLPRMLHWLLLRLPHWLLDYFQQLRKSS
jgi:hypothetical protein